MSDVRSAEDVAREAFDWIEEWESHDLGPISREYVEVLLDRFVAEVRSDERAKALADAAAHLPGGLSSNGAREWLREQAAAGRDWM